MTHNMNYIFNQFILATRKGVQSQGNRKFKVRSISISKVQLCTSDLLQMNQIGCLALAVTSDGNIDQLGNSDDGDLSVQDDAKKS